MPRRDVRRNRRDWIKAAVLSILAPISGFVVAEAYFRHIDERAKEVAASDARYPTAVQYLEETDRYFRRMIWAGGEITFHHRAHLDEDFQGVRIRTNGEGWRNPEVKPEKGGRFRILILGDSVTLGWGVDEVDTFPRRLEALLRADPPGQRPIDVINLGAGGYNTTMERAAFEKFGIAYQPDMVMLVYTNNDIHSSNGRDELDHAESERALGEGVARKLALRWRRLVKASATLTRIAYASKRRAYATRREEIVARFGSVEAYWSRHPGWAASRAELERIARICRARGWPFIVVYYSLSDDFLRQELVPRLRAIASVEGFTFVDTLDHIPLRGDLEPYINSRDDYHPNGRLHARLARMLDGVVRSTLARPAP